MAIGDTNSMTIQIRSGKLYINGERWTSDISQNIDASQIKLGEILFGITGTYGGYDSGTFVVPNNTTWDAVITVPHNLGKTPNSINIWIAPQAACYFSGMTYIFMQFANGIPYYYDRSNHMVYNAAGYFSVTADENNIYIKNISGSGNFGIAWGQFFYEVR